MTKSSFINSFIFFGVTLETTYGVLKLSGCQVIRGWRPELSLAVGNVTLMTTGVPLLLTSRGSFGQLSNMGGVTSAEEYNLCKLSYLNSVHCCKLLL